MAILWVAIPSIIAWKAGWIAAGLSGLVLLVAGWRAFTPVVFEFGPLGVAQRVPGRRTRRIAWSEMGRVEFLSRGLLITVDPEQPLGSLRSVYICYAGHRARLEQVVATYTQPQPRGRSGEIELPGSSIGSTQSRDQAST